jgi:hypothetical protein
MERDLVVVQINEFRAGRQSCWENFLIVSELSNHAAEDCFAPNHLIFGPEQSPSKSDHKDFDAFSRE